MSACRGAAPIERWTRSCRACSSTLRQFPLLSFYGLLFAPEGRASELSRINCRGTLECSEKRKRVPESAPLTSQQKYRLRRRRDGLCVLCGGPRPCRRHNERARAERRAAKRAALLLEWKKR